VPITSLCLGLSLRSWRVNTIRVRDNSYISTAPITYGISLHSSLAHSKSRSYCAPGLRFLLLQLLISSRMLSVNPVELYLGPGFIGMITHNLGSINADIDIFFPFLGFIFCLSCAFIERRIKTCSLICPSFKAVRGSTGANRILLQNISQRWQGN
jgi:hypothetical protein